MQVGHFLDLREQNKSFSDMAAYFAFYGVGDNKLTGSRRTRAAHQRSRLAKFLFLPRRRAAARPLLHRR